MTIRKIILSLIPFLILGLCLPSALAQKPDPHFGPLASSIEEEMSRTGTPGAAVLVISDGSVVYRASFGTESVETERPLREDSLFRLGSTTKMFIALAALRLESEGRLDLEAPIGDSVADLSPELTRLTMHQLLSHTGGLRDDAPMHGPIEESALASRVRSWGAEAFFTEPGRIFSYANPGYVLASYVIETVAGQPLEEAMQSLVFEPLGMRHSTFRPLVAMTYPLALGHHAGQEGPVLVRPFAENAANWAPGSMFTNLDDLGRFLLAFLNEGKLDGEQVVPASVTTAIRQPRARVAALDRQYGYGLLIRLERGLEIVGHSGARLGHGSIIWTVPDRGVAIAILTNRTGAVFHDSARKALDLLLDLAPPDEPSPINELEMSPGEMTAYAGDYINSREVQARLLVDEGRLQLVTPGGPVEVRKIGPMRFHAPGAGPLTHFVLVPDDSGKVEYLAAEYWATRKASHETKESKRP